MHWLAVREHSRVELVHNLQKKGFDHDVAQLALDELAAEGSQSDERFLETFVRSRYGKGRGAEQIRHELRHHGIGGVAMNQSLSAYDWDECLLKVHRKKYGDSPPNSPKEFASRLRFLSQRGFEQDRIQALMRRLRRGED